MLYIYNIQIYGFTNTVAKDNTEFRKKKLKSLILTH